MFFAKFFVKKQDRRSDMEEKIISRCAKGMTTGDIESRVQFNENKWMHKY